MLRLLVDTSTWLDLAKDVQGQSMIVTLRGLMREERIDLLVPRIVVQEFARNRARVEAEMTRSTAAQLRRARQAIEEHGRSDRRQTALDELDDVAFREPLIQKMATRNFDDVADLLSHGSLVEPTVEDQCRAVNRALAKQAPFHRDKNSVADALLIEMYGSACRAATPAPTDHYCFVTHNTKDFSTVDGDTRLPHADFAPQFDGVRSHYFTSLRSALHRHFPDEFDELLGEHEFLEEPRSLGRS
jgi:hypothetical protein